MKKLWIIVALFSFACASAPPKLSPPAQASWQKTRVLKALDLLRDAAIDAEAQTPKLLSTDTTRKVVQWHQASLRVMQATDVGWKQAVTTSLDALIENLKPGEQGTLRPYLDLVRVLLNAVPSTLAEGPCEIYIGREVMHVLPCDWYPAGLRISEGVIR